MKKRLFLTGGIIWTIIAMAVLAVLVAGLLGKQVLGGRGMLDLGGSELVKEERFSISGVETLTVSVSHHSLDIMLVDGSELIIKQYDRDSENLFTARSDGGSLSVGIDSRNIITVLGININPRLEIGLPRSYANDISLETSSGSVRLEDALSCGMLQVSTSSGSVRLGDLNLRSLTIATSSGTQRLGKIDASGKLTLASTSGSINTGDLRAANISVKASSGTLRLGDISSEGRLELYSSSGSQRVDYAEALMFDIETSSGTLDFKGLSGEGSVESGSGSIRCDSLDVRGDVAIRSSSGTQRLTLAENPSFEIRIDTSSGTIRAGDIELNYSGRDGKRASGTIGNGSNGTLSLKSSSGSINID